VGDREIETSALDAGRWASEGVRQQFRDVLKAKPLRAIARFDGLGEIPSNLDRRTARFLLRLRVGVSARVGGHLHSVPFSCPLCGTANLQRQGGAAVRHLFSCTSAPAPEGVSVTSLWHDPLRALEHVNRVLALRP